jgi:hypothetical protein
MKVLLAILIVCCTITAAGIEFVYQAQDIDGARSSFMAFLMLAGIYGGFVLGREGSEQFSSMKHSLFDSKTYVGLHPK